MRRLCGQEIHSGLLPTGICPGSMYFLENLEMGEEREISGASLIHDGFTFALSARSAAIWFYRRKSE